MEEVAYITAIRFTRKKLLQFQLKNCIYITRIIGKILKISIVIIIIQDKILVKEMHLNKGEKAVDVIFTFATVNELNKLLQIDEKRIWNC